MAPDEALADAFAKAFRDELSQSSRGASREACLRAAATACRGLLGERWARTQAADRQRLDEGATRRVHYLSMEFLMGRALGNALAALGLAGDLQKALAPTGQDLGGVLEREPDAALGNGGLGRLAACFLDSFAELDVPSFGYGLRYRYGMFAQQIQDGRQVEVPDAWMQAGACWDVPRPELSYPVGFGGRVLTEGGARRWIPGERMVAEAFDFIVPAHQGEHVSTLRQWQARAEDPIDFAAFSRGDHAQAARLQVQADALNWVLYPDDSSQAGRELRLKQEAFLVSASLQDLIARHIHEHGNLHQLGRRNAIHLNDTHPALAPAELMRLLTDVHGLAWDDAWTITRQAMSYTNHTLMPEALETWPLRLFEDLLPRHLEIIYEINHRFLADVAKRFPGDDALLSRVSLIDEKGERRVRMAALAIVASHKVNGVSALHSNLMVETIFSDFAKLFPDRFINVTNGVTPRRWLMQANPGLSSLLDSRIGDGWRRDLGELSKLAPMAADPVLGAQFLATKRHNKVQLAELIRRELGIAVDPDSLFDVQVKRIHEYKRQLLNLLHVVARYHAIIDKPGAPVVPRTVILSGKAASAYHSAKLIIQLAHDIARVVNSDPRVAGRLKLVFLPNYSVSLAEAIIPAADLSEQISTAGTEASGTGNMKFGMNGALTIGTWDGANIEMAQAMGEQNMFVFGLSTEQVSEVKALGYDPRLHVEENRSLMRVMDAIAGGQFSRGDERRYRPLTDGLLNQDNYLLMADFGSYLQAQSDVDALFAQPEAWATRALLNIAAMGEFSADQTIARYLAQVWRVPAAG
ncbi:MAG: glycogen phosphorylase [Gammaproteobacteria bacterium RIFCSPHIGHO2_12_FULL_63_22]|nr:MAG: glycogen phosphorylase [Gammaproteobacteria bacterium RIFCSPHIGHO2_12_FULL_63_22]